MKTAIAIDSLISRDDSTLILELILNLLPHSEIYTLVHQQGGLLGRVEMHPIRSSFLSQKMESHKKRSIFSQYYGMLPSITKTLTLNPQVERIIIISRGMIHGLKIPAHVEKFLYLLEWDHIDSSQVGWQKIFKHYINDWRKKSLNKYDVIAASSEDLKKKCQLAEAKVIYPAHKTEDFSFVADQDHDFNFTHHLVHTRGAQQDELEFLFKFLLEKHVEIKVIGQDHHLADLKSKFSTIEFIGDHCEATQSLYSHKAKVIWDLSFSFFPKIALGGLATGRPVVVRDLKVNREILSRGTFFAAPETFQKQDALSRLYHDIEEAYLHFDRRSLRRLGLKFNERFFKSRFSRFLSDS